MSLDVFMQKMISPWMRQEAPYNDIVLSTRIRLARNFSSYSFPSLGMKDDLVHVKSYMVNELMDEDINGFGKIRLIETNKLTNIAKRMLVEKHLISNHFLNEPYSALLLSENEQLSVMVNEEDHLRAQVYFPGLQLQEALKKALEFDELMEKKVDFAFHRQYGYLTSCPSNIGTGMRASVMLHLPALTHSKKMQKITAIMNQLGFVVRGFFGEGSQSLGHVYQVSNQVTLGITEEEITQELERVISMLIEREEQEQVRINKLAPMMLADKLLRSYGILQHCKILNSQEAANRISDIKLAVNLGLITDLSNTLLNELMMITQPGFLQAYAGKNMNENERDMLRATIISERFRLEK